MTRLFDSDSDSDSDSDTDTDTEDIEHERGKRARARARIFVGDTEEASDEKPPKYLVVSGKEGDIIRYMYVSSDIEPKGIRQTDD